MSGRRTLLQGTVLAMSVVVIAHDIAALAVNPSFAVGDSAHTEKFLWVDYNGWHATLGFFVFAPGLYLWRRPDWAQLYAFAVVFGLLSTAIWGLLDTNPLGILSLPDQRADAIFHVGAASIYVLAAMADGILSALRVPQS